ncbi:MAG TPA: SMC-Scp complex subunit ScpB [Longimicrobiales bacterium]|nr:SMC-Scp complex subunit ScpB [Longimicrobiales bacterium]
MQTKQIVEALLFASDAPLAAADLARADEILDEPTVVEAIQALRQEYEKADHAFQVYELAGGFQILTRPDFAPYLERFATVSRPSRLSPAALEVLAIIAYRQPIGRAEVEEIRGVGSSGVLRTLQERELIDVVGRGEGLGRPLLYGLTQRFLEHFGLRSMDDLPRPDELPVVLRQSIQPLSEDERAAAEEDGPEAAPSAAAGEEPASDADDDARADAADDPRA